MREPLTPQPIAELAAKVFNENAWIPRDARPATLLPSSIRCGDFVMWQGAYYKVITIQRDCVSFENLSKRFTMFTLADSEGHIMPCRSLFGRRSVLRIKRKVVL